MNLPAYRAWLKQHLEEATLHYEKVNKLAEEDEENQDYYDQSHQMFGYIAALEKCVRELDRDGPVKSEAAPG